MHNRKTSKKVWQREQLILALLQQPGLEKAAAVVGVSATTAWRIFKTPEFQQEYRQARRECFSQTMARLQQAAGAAVSTLLKIMVDPRAPAASRVNAAASVLHYAARAIEVEDIEVRVSELERRTSIPPVGPPKQEISAGFRKTGEARRAMRSPGTSKKVRQREQLILALLQQAGLEKAAAVVGVSATTAWRISKTPEFQQEYRQAHRECFSQTMARLQQASSAAVSTLLRIMTDPNAPAASRVRAATSVLEHAARAIETEEIELRVSELEQAAEAATPRGTK